MAMEVPPVVPEFDIPSLLFPPNFQRLKYHRDWPTTWTHIVSGRFSPKPYGGLLFYEQSNGYAEFYDTDGYGGISFLRSHSDWRDSWTHIVPGRFSDSPFTGLLLYDQQEGFAAIYGTDGTGKLIKLREFDGWGSSWTHITTVRIADSDYTAVVLYAQAAGRGEIHRCNGSGELALYKSSKSWRTSWTHVVGDFTSGSMVPKEGSGLLFYEGGTGHCEIYSITTDPNELGQMSLRDGMPPATDIIPGNFGWSDTGFLFYDRPTGRAAFVFREGPGSITISPEAYDDWRATWDIIVPGKFWEADPEHTRFQNGFTDLLFYDRAKGYGEFWLHEPFGSIIVQDLEGYTSSGSVAPGETVSFYVNSRIGEYTISVFRQDVDEVFMAVVPNIQQFPQPFPIGRLDYRDGPAWPPVANLVIPQSWPSGLYLAHVEATNGDASAIIPFVVRAATPGSQAKILVFIADTTYEAYNFWGGRSLYGFRSSIAPGIQWPTWSYGSKFQPYDDHQLPRAFRVSFRRPYNVDPGSTWPKWQYWEVPLLRWLARQGIAVEVCTSTDLHKAHVNHTDLLENYHLVVSVGHDEYWSREMRDGVEAFTAAGGNVAFFSANVCWFQTRFDLNVSRQICYKDARFDPLTPAQSDLATVNWYDHPVCRAETALTGVSYYDPRTPAPCYRVLDPDHWVFAGVDSEFFGVYVENEILNTVVGYEIDRFQSSGDSCKPRSPQSFHRLAEVPEVGASGQLTGQMACTMGIFTHGKGQVFTAATTNWSFGLSQDDDSWTEIDQITRNVIDRLG